jgi:hypothetical protein
MDLLGGDCALSFLLFIAGAYCLSRAKDPPPENVRSESGRSPAEYAFRAHAATLRRSGEICVAAGVINLLIALVLGLMYAFSED